MAGINDALNELYMLREAVNKIEEDLILEKQKSIAMWHDAKLGGHKELERYYRQIILNIDEALLEKRP